MNEMRSRNGSQRNVELERSTSREEEETKKKWVKNISSIILTEDQIKVLEKGGDFAVTPKKIPIEDYIVTTEMASTMMTKGEAAAMRAEVTEMLMKSKPPESNLKRNEWKALRELKRNKEIVILNADKGKCLVVMDRSEYIRKMEEKLADEMTYKKIEKDPTYEIKEEISKKLKDMEREGEINNGLYLRLLPKKTQIPRMYGLPKIHRKGTH